MKVLAYYPLHYGAEYLEASIKSIESLVDKIVILYTERPSYGYDTNIPCPETEDQLKAIATQFDKVEWVRVSAGHEGEHRNLIAPYTQGYDILLAVDADEIWETGALKKCLNEAYNGDARRYNIAGFINFWKSFNYCCLDGFVPARIFNLRRDNIEEKTITGCVFHFGYAQSRAIMEYKFLIHGHKDELIEGWFEKYFNWNEESRFLHPVSKDAWERVQKFNKETLPDILKQHPNFDKDSL